MMLILTWSLLDLGPLGLYEEIYDARTPCTSYATETTDYLTASAAGAPGAAGGGIAGIAGTAGIAGAAGTAGGIAGVECVRVSRERARRSTVFSGCKYRPKWVKLELSR